MSVRRQTVNRLTLLRACGACGRPFRTTADNPFMRQLPRDGKRQATTYFCSETCWRSSYKHPGWWDGKAEERRREREALRDNRARNRRYYAAHAEELRARAKANYWADPESARAANAYARKKRKLLNKGKEPQDGRE